MKTSAPELSPALRSRPAFFDSFFREPFSILAERDFPPMTIPAANLTEAPDDFQIELAAPGLKKEDFNVETNGPLLTVSATHERSETEENDRDVHYQEYQYTSFSRTFRLPDTANLQQIKALYRDGILRIKVAKREPAPQKPPSVAIPVD